MSRIETRSSDPAGRCVDLLKDDHARRGGYLDIDDVTRVVLGCRLTPEQAKAVWVGLRAAGILASVLVTREAEPVAVDRAAKPQRSRDAGGFSRASWAERYGSYKLLTPEEEVQLARRFHAARLVNEPNGDVTANDIDVSTAGEEARVRLILSNVRLVIHCASRYVSRTSIPMDDLVQDGLLGLFRAAEKFDPERGFKFSTYATWWVNQSISRSIDDRSRLVRLPVHVSSGLWRMRRKRLRLTAVMGRRPTTEEIARDLGIPVSDVEFLLQVERDIASLDVEPAGGEGERRLDRVTCRRSENPVVETERRELTLVIATVLKTLDSRARRVLVMRFGLDGRTPRTLEQVGKKLGVTRERIRQIEKRALERLGSAQRGALLRQLNEGGDE